MDKNNMTELIESLGFERQLLPEELPSIDLYMDQVIQLFENTFGSATRNEGEKVLTKTMINNYAKGKLFTPVKNKKYSREQLMMISLIYQLKGSLSIQDIKQTLDGANNKALKGNLRIEEFYSSYLQLAEQNLTGFKEDVPLRCRLAREQAEELEAGSSELEKILLILSLVHMGNMYRRTAERLIDELGGNPPAPKG
ncbi:DUF1836 domain-containing protein [Bacillus infantis]|uniref:DUF1836 domain-containing protein n=1 Tax=Bacillus infantis TaxID=324767 RepID=UPI002FBDB629